MKNAGRIARRHWPLTLILVVLIVVLMTPHSLERFYVYYPTREVVGNPSDLGLAYQDVVLSTEDGIKLHGWFVPYADARITVLIFHGNAGNIGHRLGWLGMLHRLNVNLFIIDYRGFGRSEGKPFEQGLYRDATSAYLWWAGKKKSTGEKLVLLGESLGGAVALELASRVPVAGVILQSTFTSARDMAKTLFPLGLLQPLIGVHFDSAAKIRSVTCPKLIIHGNQDEIVPFRLGRKLFDLAPEPKQFFEVQGARHNDLIWAGEPQYTRRIADFLVSLEK